MPVLELELIGFVEIIFSAAKTHFRGAQNTQKLTNIGTHIRTHCKTLQWLGMGVVSRLRGTPTTPQGWDKGALMFKKYWGRVLSFWTHFKFFFYESLANKKSAILDFLHEFYIFKHIRCLKDTQIQTQPWTSKYFWFDVIIGLGCGTSVL